MHTPQATLKMLAVQSLCQVASTGPCTMGAWAGRRDAQVARARLSGPCSGPLRQLLRPLAVESFAGAFSPAWAAWSNHGPRHAKHSRWPLCARQGPCAFSHWWLFPTWPALCCARPWCRLRSQAEHKSPARHPCCLPDAASYPGDAATCRAVLQQYGLQPSAVDGAQPSKSCCIGLRRFCMCCCGWLRPRLCSYVLSQALYQRCSRRAEGLLL